LPAIKPETVSVVVPTYGRPDALAATLDALLQMDYPASDFEVIVVDDGSDIATERVVRARQKGAIAVEYRTQPNSGAATARNHGARMATGEHLFFCDDDILVQRNHLRSVSETLRRFSNPLVNGDLHFSPGVEAQLRQTSFGRYRLDLDRRYQAEANGRALGNGCFEADLLTACNLAVGRELFWELGGFDEAFPYAGAEDQALSLTAAERGCLLLRDQRVRVLHNDQTLSFRKLCSREERSAQTFVVLVRRFPEQRERPLFARNAPITSADGVAVAISKLGKTALSREPVLDTLHRITGRLERRRVRDQVLRRMYRTVLGLHIFRGVRIAIGDAPKPVNAGHRHPP
jgi:glycosyltransferase involved in cell wall biosynthesis